MDRAGRCLTGHSGSRIFWPTIGRRLLQKISAAAPAFFFGLRLWAAVCLAMYVAFRLELDNAYWAGTSAAIVCQPSLGASLRKGAFRMVGTLVGAVAIVILTSFLSQDRVGFLLGVALWGAACAYVATILENFMAYAAALAGVTAMVIASDALVRPAELAARCSLSPLRAPAKSASASFAQELSLP
jgi:uncharacterized membrane protein YccC